MTKRKKDDLADRLREGLQSASSAVEEAPSAPIAADRQDVISRPQPSAEAMGAADRLLRLAGHQVLDAEGPRWVLVDRNGRAHPLRAAGPISIGRARHPDGASIVVKDASVSRRHALVREVDGQVYVEDQVSTNGTWIRRGDRDLPVVGAPIEARADDLIVTINGLVLAEIVDEQAEA